MAQVNEALIKAFGDKLNGDDHTFWVVDLRLPEDEQLPVEVTGEMAKGFIRNGHYFVKYKGPNSTSKANLIKNRQKIAKEAAGTIEMPVISLDQADKVRNENEQLKAHIKILEAQLSASSRFGTLPEGATQPAPLELLPDHADTPHDVEHEDEQAALDAELAEMQKGNNQ